MNDWKLKYKRTIYENIKKYEILRNKSDKGDERLVH